MYERDIVQNEVKCICEDIRRNQESLLQHLYDMRVREYGTVLQYPLKVDGLDNIST